MGWEAVYPSLVEETKGTWQNKPQMPPSQLILTQSFIKNITELWNEWFSLVKIIIPAQLYNH